MLIPRSRLVLLAAVVAAGAAASWWLRDSLKPESMVPRPVPPGPRPVTLRDGKTRDLARAPGKLLVVHFWATWCPPCVEELPGLLEYARSVKDDPAIEVLAVSVDTDWKTVDDFLAKTKATGLPVALDPERATAKKFGTEMFPETWFLDPSGKVIEAFIGPVEWGRAATRKRLAELRAIVKGQG